MAFCSNCGASLTDGMKFCPNCGSPVSDSTGTSIQTAPVTDTTVYTQPVAQTVQTTASYQAANDYRVILFSRGSCRVGDARELLEDIMGYTPAQARQLVSDTPAEIACNMTLTQAEYLAQALTEYGMEVSICNSAGYVSSSVPSGSVYDSRGNLLPAVTAALATISAINHVARISRWDYPGPPPAFFRLGFYRPAPPMHMRRPGLFGRPAPMAPHPPVGMGGPRGGRPGGFGGGPRGGMGGGPRGGGRPGSMGGGPRGGGRSGGMGGGPRGGGRSGGMGGGPRGGMGGPGGHR